MEIIKAEEYQEKIASGFVLVDFFAAWCEPCKLLQRQLSELSGQFEQLKIYQIDVETAGELIRQLKVISLPTMLLYKDGDLLKEINGYYPSSVLKKLLTVYLNSENTD